MAKYTSRYTAKEIDAKHGAHLFDSNTNELIHFGSVDEKQRYIDGDTSVELGRTRFDFQGTLYRINMTNYVEGGTSLNFTQNTTSVDISVGFQLQTKSITDAFWEDIAGAKYNVSVEIDKGGKDSWKTLQEYNGLDGTLDVSIDAKANFSVGTNRVRVKVVDTEGLAEGTVMYVVSITSMYLVDAGVEWNLPFYAGQTSYNIGLFKIGGAINKSFNMRIQGDGVDYTYSKNIGTQQNVENGVTMALTGFVYPAIDGIDINGTYDVSFWLEANGTKSEVLKYRMMFVSDTASRLVCINDVGSVYNEEPSKLFAYSIYNAGETTAQPTITVSYGDDILISNSNQTVETNVKHDFNATLTVSSFDESFTVVGMVENEGSSDSATITVDNTMSFPATLQGLQFYLDATSRTNQDNNKEKIINEAPDAEVSEYATSTTEVSYVDGMDGWTTDDEGHKCLRLQAKSRMEILGFNPLKKASASDVYQGSIEFVYKVINPSSDTDPVISILDGSGNGICLAPKLIYVKSSTDASYYKQDYRPYADERLHVMIAFSKNYLSSGENFIVIYVNGTIVREFTYLDSESFDLSTGDGGHIVFGSDTADLYLYKARIYSEGLERALVVQNRINSLPTREERIAEYNRVNSVVINNIIDYQTCVDNGYNTMVIEMLDGGELPSLVNQEKDLYCNLNINIRQKTSDGQMLVDTEIDSELAELLKGKDILNQPIEGQGTTAMTYGRWNFRWKLGSTYGKRRITAKKNFASSMHSHKMGATRLFNYLHHELGLDNEANSKVAVTQYPVYGFVKKLIGDGVYGYEPIGLYTIGADKGDKATFGYDDDTYKETLIHMEGSDHNATIVGMEYPWMDDDSTIGVGVERLGAIGADGTVTNSWEIGACGELDTEVDFDDIYSNIKAEFRDAYMVAYRNSPFIKYISAEDRDKITSSTTEAEAWRNDNSGYEFWDDNYDLYYYNVQYGLYKKSMNILTDLNVTSVNGDDTDARTESIVNLRKERFKAEWGNYWHTDDCIFHFAFCQLIGATDNFKKNSYPYKFGAISSGSRWRWRQDDLDTIFDIDNTNNSTKTYSILVGDKIGKDSIYKGEDSVFWTLVRTTQKDAIDDMTRRMLSIIASVGKGANTQDSLIKGFKKFFWDNAQLYFPSNAYNSDANWSYELSYINGWYSTPIPLEQSLGSHYETEYDWVTLRMIFISSMLSFGAFANNTGYEDTSLGQLTYRGGEAFTFKLTPAIDMCPALMIGTNSLRKYNSGRVLAGTPIDLSQDALSGQNTQVYLPALDWYASIGNLSDLVIEEQDGENSLIISSAKRLVEFVLGGEGVTVSSNINKVNMKNCPSLELFDGRNSQLAGSLDLTSCPRIQEVYLTGTGVTSVSLPSGSKIKTLHLSSSTTALTFDGLQYLTDLVIPDLALIQSLSITDCGTLGITTLFDILAIDGNVLSEVNVTFDTYTIDSTQFSQLYALVAKGAKVQMSGTLIIDGLVYESEKDYILEEVSGALVITTEDEYYMEFADPVVRQIMADTWGDGVGVTEAKVKTITSLGEVFRGNTEIKTFEELENFEGLVLLSTNSSNIPGVFANCTSLEKVTFPKRLEEMQGSAFSGCTSLDIRVELPESFFGLIPAAAFANTAISAVVSLGGAKSSSSPTYATQGSFAGCTELTEVSFDEGFEDIGKGMFYGCEALKVINFSDSIKTIGGVAFYGCALEIGNLALENLESIAGAFSATSAITKISNLGRITAIPADGNYGNNDIWGNPSSLQAVSIPNTVKTIGSYSFHNYTNLETISIDKTNNSLTTIEASAFSGCSALKNVVYVGEDTPSSELVLNHIETIGNYAFYNTRFTKIEFGDTFVIMPERPSDYPTYGHKSVLKSVTAMGVTSIGMRSFYGYTELASVSFDWDNIVSVGYAAFFGCTSLNIEDLNLPKLQTLGNYAFHNCNIKKISNLGSITSIPTASYNENIFGKSVESVVLPTTLQTLGGYAFCSNKSLTSVVVSGDNLTSIGACVFESCTALNSVMFENKLTKLATMSNYTFNGCSSLRKVWMDDSSKYKDVDGYFDIHANLFGAGYTFYTSQVEVAVLSVEVIGPGSNYRGVFSGCQRLRTLLIMENCESIGSYLLSYNTTVSCVLICLATTPPALGTGMRHASLSNGLTIYVPTASVDAYKEATNWSSFADVIHGLDELSVESQAYQDVSLYLSEYITN